MNAIYVVATVCSISLSGCVRHRERVFAQSPQKDSSGKDQICSVEIKKPVISNEGLKLEYSVHNVSPHDIWVCEGINIRSRGQNVETRIENETLRIRLLFGLETNIERDRVFAKYRRLPQGQSHSGVIDLRLPVMNRSPVYLFREDLGTPQKMVTLHRVTFEVGYFAEDLLTLISQSKEKGWVVPGLHIWQPASTDPNVVVVPDVWQGLQLERSVQVMIDDVAIPGRLGGRD